MAADSSAGKAADAVPAAKNGMEVPWYTEGDKGPQLFSAADMNVHVAILRALVNPEVRWGDGDKAEFSDANFVIQLDEAKATGGAFPYIVIDASAGDYFVCRRLIPPSDSEDEDPPDFTDVFVAKPYNLRRTPFNGKTVAMTVERYDGMTFSSQVRSIFYNYLSATFRSATDVTDVEHESTEYQTIIPRFIPATSDSTVAPTIIMAASAIGLGVTGPDGKEIAHLAQNDGWAWAKTS